MARAAPAAAGFLFFENADRSSSSSSLRAEVLVKRMMIDTIPATSVGTKSNPKKLFIGGCLRLYPLFYLIRRYISTNRLIVGRFWCGIIVGTF